MYTSIEPIESMSLYNILCVTMQSAPLDLFTEYFYINRKERIDAKLQWLRSTTDEVYWFKQIVHA